AAVPERKEGPYTGEEPGRPRRRPRAAEEDARVPAVAHGNRTGQEVTSRSPAVSSIVNESGRRGPYRQASPRPPGTAPAPPPGAGPGRGGGPSPPRSPPTKGAPSCRGRSGGGPGGTRRGEVVPPAVGRWRGTGVSGPAPSRPPPGSRLRPGFTAVMPGNDH